MALTDPDTPSFWHPYPQQAGQRTRLFRIYNNYRLVVSAMLIGFAIIAPTDFDIRMLDPYQAGVFGYAVLNGFIGLLLLSGFRPEARHINLSILADILFMHAFLFFSTGISSAMANLIIVSVAAGNILTPSRIGTFYAALAALCSLGLAGWAVLAQGTDVDVIVRAGSLGILYFLAAFVLQYITHRMTRSEALADDRAKSIAELEKINQQIIQRMRTGIMVTDQHGTVRVSNAAADELLFGTPPSIHASTRGRPLPAPLRERLDSWLQAPLQKTAPFQSGSTSPLLQANFTRLDQQGADLILVFIDDLSKVTQQAQQMKLASLGHLTAGIAHEVRNPLGAISHAAQLMSESKHADPHDRKMLEIIHRHSRRVNLIIENILDLSRRQTPNSEPVIVNDWLPTFVQEYRQSLLHGERPSPEITLAITAGLPIARFDRSQIEQVLMNLCDNGLHYSVQQTGRATLSLTAGITSDGERVYIDIRDDGPGVKPEHRASIFEPFFTTGHSGIGLGLYLARELCEANQAHLSLLDGSPPGCCFRIIFAHHGRML
ncbi:sensor histidine kinase [Marinobacter sp. X15-166B]|uniref:sensor histidine kinase n=1 Tax=Marinobacter sp. X15-166B TaxID=1897620 RepID=UPI00085CDAAC|nr:ATP-binding protein [Marinobacter sp. X15-166B]OEY66663.1 histidine kinase [Marinobacter sp. X15-166B]